MFGDRIDRSRGDANNHRTSIHISGDDRACTYDCVVGDPNPREDRGIAPDRDPGTDLHETGNRGTRHHVNSVAYGALMVNCRIRIDDALPSDACIDGDRCHRADLRSIADHHGRVNER